MRQAISHPDVFKFPAACSAALRAGNSQTLLNIQRLLEAGGAGWEHVARMTYCLADISQWASVSAIRREFLAEPYPAGTAVEVSRLVNTDWLIELEAVAILPG